VEINRKECRVYNVLPFVDLFVFISFVETILCISLLLNFSLLTNTGSDANVFLHVLDDLTDLLEGSDFCRLYPSFPLGV
jgi:hypothetical protein